MFFFLYILDADHERDENDGCPTNNGLGNGSNDISTMIKQHDVNSNDDTINTSTHSLSPNTSLVCLKKHGLSDILIQR